MDIEKKADDDPGVGENRELGQNRKAEHDRSWTEVEDTITALQNGADVLRHVGVGLVIRPFDVDRWLEHVHEWLAHLNDVLSVLHDFRETLMHTIE